MFLIKKDTMNNGVKKFRETEGAVLLDVRTVPEYKDGHVPGSINIPLDDLANVEDDIPDYDTPVFVHCKSGGRAAIAVAKLKEMGYTRVENIGGIIDYKGDVET